jgi:septum formation protein
MVTNIVLASASPRRLELLRNAGFSVEARPSHIPEVRRPGESGVDYVRRMAREKALAADWRPGETLVAADTVVEAEGSILEKPQDPGDAARMLRMLSARWHQVHTGVAIRHDASVRVDAATTRVLFLPMTDEEIGAYVATGEPMDKAGAYAIQGIASRYIDRIDGCYFNVVGLPVSLLVRMLRT